ncbi:MAG: hypothetical protein ABFD81_10845 [Syntrophaceae bacterium]
MRKETTLAVYDHGTCGSIFFAEIDNPERLGYEGKCPNPHCNKRVALSPKTFFHSIDKARRDYIKKARSGRNSVYWQI